MKDELTRYLGLMCTSRRWLRAYATSRQGRTVRGRDSIRNADDRTDADERSKRTVHLRDYYQASAARGLCEELANVTLAREIAAVALHLWKKEEVFDSKELTMQAT